MLTENDIKRIAQKPSGATESQISSIAEELYNQRQTNRLLAQEMRSWKHDAITKDHMLTTQAIYWGKMEHIWKVSAFFGSGIIFCLGYAFSYLV